ncbi:MAG: hypothetical protein GF317_16845 [Candidatus Lokiarchaeota archaeon]|nr:hypothetical protein [Candidatus Lokiarchaeota archaeon]MBD3201186.1 hypothetical protein [Candidatus Lokiarchaeota archaeon]
MKIAIIYFSATNNTALIADKIEEYLIQIDNEINVLKYDITSHKNQNKVFDAAKFDFLFFGFPVYAWRIPRPMRIWLKKLEGKQKLCSLFFTYGGINSGVVHYDTTRILKEQGFTVITSIEIVTNHSFNICGWNVLENRPDENDFKTLNHFVQNTLKKIKSHDLAGIIFDRPTISEKTLSIIEKNPIRAVRAPKRIASTCSMCLLCEEKCPTEAFTAESGCAKSSLCIRCLRCINICPDEVIETNNLAGSIDLVLKAEKLTLRDLENRKSKIFF